MQLCDLRPSITSMTRTEALGLVTERRNMRAKIPKTAVKTRKRKVKQALEELTALGIDGTSKKRKSRRKKAASVNPIDVIKTMTPAQKKELLAVLAKKGL